MLREYQYAAGVRVVVDGVIAATAELRPGMPASWGARAVGLLYGLAGWYTLFYLLGAVLCALPHVYRKRFPGETLQAQALRQEAEKRAREKNPAARSAYDALPWQRRFVLNPWSAIGLGLALWFGVPGLIALAVPGVRYWNMICYLAGGAFGVLTSWSWFRGKRVAMYLAAAALVAVGAGVFLALQGAPLGDDADIPEIALSIGLIVAGVPFLSLYLALLGAGSGGGGSSYHSSASRSSSRASSSGSSSSSRSSGSSSYRGGGGRFGGGGASSSW
jgi:uncharacterized membrane protein YgcG